MEPLTFRALIRTIIQVKKNDKLEKIPVFRKDYKAIGLVFEKFMKRQINLPERKSFLKELHAVLGYRYSLKIFVAVPNYLHLLHDLLNLDPNGDASDGDVRAMVQKILRKFISFALFEDDQQRVFDLIALIEFNSYSIPSPLKQMELLSKKDEVMNDSDLKPFSHNFFKLIKPIEFTLKEYRDRNHKKHNYEETKINTESITDKKMENYNTKKSIVPNICQFVFYIEHFLLKAGKNIEQEEVQIVQFTSVLFDFLYDTQILHLISPSMKPIPTEIYPNAIAKRFEGLCHRNGGPLISMLTIIFTVLQNSNIIPEKILLIRCCSIIFGLYRHNRNSEAYSSKSAKERLKDSGSSSNPLKDLLVNAAKCHPGSEIKKDMNMPLVEAANAEKLPDILTQKVICHQHLFSI